MADTEAVLAQRMQIYGFLSRKEVSEASGMDGKTLQYEQRILEVGKKTNLSNFYHKMNTIAGYPENILRENRERTRGLISGKEKRYLPCMKMNIQTTTITRIRRMVP